MMKSFLASLFSWRRMCAILLACFFAGCAADTVGTFTRVGAARPPRPRTGTVEVFKTGQPKRPFDRVAILDGHSESQWFAPPTLEDVLPELMDQARAAGCDAIIEIHEKTLDNPGNFETRGCHFTAVGVAYR